MPLAASSAARMSLFWVLVQRPLKLTEALTAWGSATAALPAHDRRSPRPPRGSRRWTRSPGPVWPWPLSLLRHGRQQVTDAILALGTHVVETGDLRLHCQALARP